MAMIAGESRSWAQFHQMDITNTNTVSVIERFPLEIFHEMFKFMDVGHIIDTCQSVPIVRRAVVADIFFWQKLGRKRLGITLNKEDDLQPYQTILHWWWSILVETTRWD
jgi:hypothetical protein